MIGWKVTFHWWRLKRPEVVWAAQCDLATLAARKKWCGVKSVKGFKRGDYK